MKPYYQDSAVTIYHGDCREILPELPKVDLVLTDPPYGMDNNCDYSRFTRGRKGHGKESSRQEHDQVIGDDEPFDPLPFIDYPRVILFGFNHFASRLPVGTTLIWIKRFDNGFGMFLSDAEVAWMKGGYGVYCRRDTSLFGEANSRRHPTEKPVNLMKWCILKAGGDGLILDPFMGSGTTLRAAKDLGRKAIGIEIEERYCEIAARRMEQEVLPLNTDFHSEQYEQIENEELIAI
jgi:site-specific DNA-methyltransferase (adenine-specific)